MTEKAFVPARTPDRRVPVSKRGRPLPPTKPPVRSLPKRCFGPIYMDFIFGALRDVQCHVGVGFIDETTAASPVVPCRRQNRAGAESRGECGSDRPS